jgi:hypothetical protein
MDMNGRGIGKAKPRSKARTLVVGLGEVGAAPAAILDRKETVLRHDLAPVKIAEPVGVMHLCIPFQSRTQFESAVLSYISRFQPSLTIINAPCCPELAARSRRRAVLRSHTARSGASMSACKRT